MKRHRVLRYGFDVRANILKMEINPDWDEEIKGLWEENKKSLNQELLVALGELDAEEKVGRFIELGALMPSLIAYHNKFLEQVRIAYAMGSYYPALTSTCALGERILNHLIIDLREDFRNTSEYKNVYRKDSFDNWDVAIETLDSWEVLLPAACEAFRELKKTRNRAIHFNPRVDTNDRELALAAFRQLETVVSKQFATHGNQPWFIRGTKSNGFIKAEWVDKPFVKRVILPCCALVGPRHSLQFEPSGWIVEDDHEYEEGDITDEEFSELYMTQHS